MNRRSWTRLTFLAAFLFLVFGIPFRVLGREHLQLPWWGFIVLVLAYFIYSELADRRAAHRPIDALWEALESDYRSAKYAEDRAPISGGLFGSSDLDDLCAAKSSSDESGVTVCRVQERGEPGPCMEIPWDRIESVEVVEPDEEFVQSIVAKSTRKGASMVLSAKVHLQRRRRSMTLIVPWNEEFARYAPPSIEIRKDWEWPFAVM